MIDLNSRLVSNQRSEDRDDFNQTEVLQIMHNISDLLVGIRNLLKE